MSTCLTTYAVEIIVERTLAERITNRPLSECQFQVLSGGIIEGLVDIHIEICS